MIFVHAAYGIVEGIAARESKNCIGHRAPMRSNITTFLSKSAVTLRLIRDISAAAISNTAQAYSSCLLRRKKVARSHDAPAKRRPMQAVRESRTSSEVHV